jgi:phage portal protein BeeE
MTNQPGALNEKSGLLARAAYGLGKALSAFRNGAGMIVDNASVQRPGFLSATAEAAKWKGGTYNGDRDAAQRRAIQNSWVFTAINEKAIEVSKGRLHVYRVEGMEDDAVPIPNHPFERVLRNPNPLMGRALLWQFSHWWSDLGGSSYWFLAPDEDGELAEIWPIPANAVDVFPGNKDRIIDYYEYQANGTFFHIPPNYICHFKYPNPWDIFRGLSPLVAAMLPVDSDTAMARWNGSFFGADNVMPSAVINLSSGNPAAPLDPADVDAVTEKLESEYSAARRKTIVTNAYQMAVNLLGWNAKDMDFLGGRALTKDEIFQDLGYPPGYADKNSTESNSTVGYAKFMERIFGTLGLYAEQITAQIIIPWYSGYGLDQEARFNDVRPINKDMLLREADASRSDMTVNERRKRFWNLPPRPDGDSLPAPVGQAGPISAGVQDGFSQSLLPQPMNALPENVRALAEMDLKNWRTKALKSLKSGARAAVLFTSKAIPADLLESIGEGLECAEGHDDVQEVFENAKKGIIRSWRPWSTFEERLANQVEEALRSQANMLVEKLRASGDATALEDNATWGTLRQELLNAIEPILVELAAAATARVAQTLGDSAVNVNWELANQQAEAWARQHAGELITNVEATTQQAVASTVADWSKTSEGLDGLIRRVQGITGESGQAFGRDRAETIAITEATNTYGQANAQAWETAGYPRVVFRPAAHVRCRCYIQPWSRADKSKAIVWYTARDERVCTRPIQAPWGEVQGCQELHHMIVSEGPDLGQKVD